MQMQQHRFPFFASLFNQGTRGLLNKKRVQKVDTSSLAKRWVRNQSGLKSNKIL